jgi:predicted PurR-regulated permease PerM
MVGIDHRALSAAWTVFLFALAIAVVYVIRGALVTFTLALFLALLLSPVVKQVERFTPARVPRTAALAIVYIVLIAAVVAILIPVGSAVAEDAQNLARRLPDALKENPLDRLPLPAWLEPVRERISQTLRDRIEDIGRNALPLIARGMERVVSGLGTVVNAVLIPILAFLFLKDGRALWDGMVHSLAESQRTLAVEIFSDLRVMLAQYLQALVMLSAVTFSVYSAFLAISGAPYAVLLGGVAAVLEFIPAVGPFVAAVTIVIVGALSGYPHWILLLVFFAVYRVAQDYLLQPALMSSGVRIHPLLVIFGVIAGGEMAGILGVFFSVPVIAALRVIFLRLWKQPDAT